MGIETPEEREWIRRNDNEFKFHLDRYKYPNRYDDVDHIEHREAASKFIQTWTRKSPSEILVMQFSPSSDSLQTTIGIGSTHKIGIMYTVA